MCDILYVSTKVFTCLSYEVRCGDGGGGWLYMYVAGTWFGFLHWGAFIHFICYIVEVDFSCILDVGDTKIQICLLSLYHVIFLCFVFLWLHPHWAAVRSIPALGKTLVHLDNSRFLSRICWWGEQWGFGDSEKRSWSFWLEDTRSTIEVCIVIDLYWKGHKLMVSLFWAHLCPEYAVRICSGRLLTAATNPPFWFKIAGTTNGMHYACSAQYKHLCEQICWTDLPSTCL